MKVSRIPFWFGFFTFLTAFPAAAVSLRVGSGTGCDQATLLGALNVIRTQAGTHTIRISKGNYVVPDGMVYDPTVSQTAVFLEGGYDNCLAATPTGDPTIDSGRAVFNGAGGLQRSVLDLWIYAKVGTFQIRRIALTGGDATASSPIWAKSGGGLAVRGQASVLLGIGASIKGNTATDGGGVVLTGSTILDTANFAKIDFYIDEGAEIANNIATDRGGGIYCGGINPNGSLGFDISRHGNIVFRDGTLAFNQATRGGGFFCYGTVEGGGGLQPRPRNARAAWIFGNTSSSGGIGCAAGMGTLDASTPFGASGLRELGAANGESGLLAITHNQGRNAGLCLGGSTTLGMGDVRPPTSSRFRLQNLYAANQIGATGSMALLVTDKLQLTVQPSGPSVACSFFSTVPCVTIENNDMADVGGLPQASNLLSVIDAALTMYRAMVRGNRVGGSMMSSVINSQLRIHSSIIDHNQVVAFTGIDGNTTSLLSASLFGSVHLYQSTVVMRSPLTRFILLNDNVEPGSANVHGSILASTSVPAPVNLGGSAPSGKLTREWCGFFQSTADFAGHTQIFDPATGYWVLLSPSDFNINPVTYAPGGTGLVDGCSAPTSTFNLDFYGRPFNVVSIPLSLTHADIGAVEAQLPNDVIFANGFD